MLNTKNRKKEMNQEAIELLEKMVFDEGLVYSRENREKRDQTLIILKEPKDQQSTALNSCQYLLCKGEGKLQQNAGIYYVHCQNCGQHTDSFETSAEAIKTWNNTNKSDQPSLELIKESIELDKMCVSEIVAKYESSHNAITVLKRKFRAACKFNE